MIYNSDKRRWQRECWTEWVKLSLPDGSRRPRFYLPVRRQTGMNQTILWIIPLAPLALSYYIARGVVLNIWYDLLECSDLIHREWRIKRMERRAKQTDRMMRGEDAI